jgi:hypothetical protein
VGSDICFYLQHIVGDALIYGAVKARLATLLCTIWTALRGRACGDPGLAVEVGFLAGIGLEKLT